MSRKYSKPDFYNVIEFPRRSRIDRQVRHAQLNTLGGFLTAIFDAVFETPLNQFLSLVLLILSAFACYLIMTA